VLLSRVLIGVEDVSMDSVAAIEEAADEARADEAADAGDHHRLMVCRAAYHLWCPSLLSSPFTRAGDKRSREEGEDKKKGMRKKDGVKR
jgi:hypothetical protein